MPPVGQAQDEQAALGARRQDPFETGGGQERFGGHPDGALHSEGHVEQESAGVSLSGVGCRFGSHEPKRHTPSPREPRAELDRGPIVVRAAERHDHGSARGAFLGDEQGDVARNVAEDGGHLRWWNAVPQE